MKNSIIFLCFFLFCFIACDNDEYRATYIIENATNHNVEIRFFNRQSNNYALPVLVDTRSINGPGILYKESKTLLGVTTRQVALDVYGADSLAVIFDGQDVEAHYEGLPFENSLAFFSDYMREENGDVLRYVITEENYENAVPCNGVCD